MQCRLPRGFLSNTVGSFESSRGTRAKNHAAPSVTPACVSAMFSADHTYIMLYILISYMYREDLNCVKRLKLILNLNTADCYYTRSLINPVEKTSTEW